MKLLVIQTSFIGDVVMATAVVEKLHQYFPESKIDFLLRKGNEELFHGHPFLNKVIVWNKKKNKFRNLFNLIKEIRKEKYDVVINLHRFFSTGLITVLSNAKQTRGFNKNPLSFLFNKTFPHHLGDGTTEYERNQSLIADLTDDKPAKPRIYPVTSDQKEHVFNPPFGGWGGLYICIAPASVWFTKQLPKEKWIDLILRMPSNYAVYLLGSSGDFKYTEEIKNESHQRAGTENSPRVEPQVVNLAGKLTLLQSAALMGGAAMNYVNDSAPMHICSAMNAPVTVFYLSTDRRFGFVPVSDHYNIVETKVHLDCRPCGSHGYMKCPRGHFRCALTIDMNEITLPHE